MFVLPEDPSPSVATVLRFLQGWRDIDIDTVADELLDDAKYYIFPQSLECPPLENVGEIMNFFTKTFIDRTNRYTSHIVDLIETNDSQRIVVHEECETVSTLGSVFKNEYVWIFTMAPSEDDPDEPAISVVKIFMDSHAIADFFLSEGAPDE